MPNRRYMGKERGEHEFIYVDLLPNVKRPRQFNVNILYIVLIAVAASWFLVYMPLSSRQETLDRVLEQNNDMTNQLLLLEEEVQGYRIEQSRIDFSNQIDRVGAMQTSYLDVFLPVQDIISNYNGQITQLRYDAVTEELQVVVILNTEFIFQNLNLELLEQDFIRSSSHTTPTQQAGTVRFRATYTIGVDINAE